MKSTGVYKCPDSASTGFINGTPDTSNNTPGIPVSYVANGGGGAGDVDWGGVRPIEYYDNSNPVTNPAVNPPSTSLSQIANPASCIEVGETNTTTRQDPDFWADNNDMVNINHSTRTNYLFCDGHVKTMIPTSTGSPINMWNAANTTNVGDATAGPAPANLAGWLANSASLLK